MGCGSSSSKKSDEYKAEPEAKPADAAEKKPEVPAFRTIFRMGCSFSSFTLHSVKFSVVELKMKSLVGTFSECVSFDLEFLSNSKIPNGEAIYIISPIYSTIFHWSMSSYFKVVNSQRAKKPFSIHFPFAFKNQASRARPQVASPFLFLMTQGDLAFILEGPCTENGQQAPCSPATFGSEKIT